MYTLNMICILLQKKYSELRRVLGNHLVHKAFGSHAQTVGDKLPLEIS